MPYVIFLLLVSVIIFPVMTVALREQRWFKKTLFYYFPRFLRPLSYQLRPINIYYQKLTPEERKRFEWRVYYFLNSTEIEFRGFRPSKLINYNAVRYLIASVATRMSLFLSEDCYDAFHKIIIYPDQYYSPITQKYHKGETNPGAGYIILSFNSFHKGFENTKDGVNLLMHELAHALWLENELFDYDIFERDDLEHYRHAALEVAAEMMNNDNHFLRKYALINEEEFFAVAVENFFERPDQFQKALPDFYIVMARLLKQNPLTLVS